MTAKSAIGKLPGMEQPPEKYLEIERGLGEPLVEFVAARRESRTSWRRIAIEIVQRTGIDVADESLRMWFTGRAPVNAP